MNTQINNYKLMCELEEILESLLLGGPALPSGRDLEVGNALKIRCITHPQPLQGGESVIRLKSHQNID